MPPPRLLREQAPRRVQLERSGAGADQVRVASGRLKTLALRRPDRCAVCGVDLPAGSRARWDSAARVTICLGCPVASEDAGQESLESDSPGASAMREYARRRTAREQRIRSRFGALGVLVARLTDEPVSIRVWKQGAEGERKLAARLEQLLHGTRVQLLHDRRIPRKGRANIDHIAIGPGGVTVIDAKTLHGKVSVERVGGVFSPRRDVLRVAKRDQTRLVEGVERQAETVQELLSELDGPAVQVRSALCFVDGDGLPLFRKLEASGTVIGGAKRVAKLAARPGSLSSEEVERLRRQLATGLPKA
jgi:hypothetical protein